MFGECIENKKNTRNAKRAINWTQDGERKRDRPKESWRRTIEREKTYLHVITCTGTLFHLSMSNEDYSDLVVQKQGVCRGRNTKCLSS